MTNGRVLYLILAYNEEQSLRGVIAGLRRSAPPGEIVVVDDGSTDHTAAIAAAEGATLLSLPVNLGIGGALQTGLLYAVRTGVSHLIRLDADGQHDPSEAGKLLDLLRRNEADFVIGSRFLPESGGYRSTRLRRVGIRLIRWLNKLVTGKQIFDCTSGFVGMNAALIRHVAGHIPDEYPEPELIVLTARAGFRILEVPIGMRERDGGKSSIRRGDSFLYMFQVVLAIILNATKKPEIPEDMS